MLFIKQNSTTDFVQTCQEVHFFQGGRGQWAVYNTNPQSFFYKVFIFVALTTLGTLILIVGFIKLRVFERFNC